MLYEVITEICGVVLVFSDVTDKYATEKALKETEALFSLFMKFSPVYTFIKEVSDDKSSVIMASDNYTDMAGIREREMQGRSMRDMFVITSYSIHYTKLYDGQDTPMIQALNGSQNSSGEWDWGQAAYFLGWSLSLGIVLSCYPPVSALFVPGAI